LSHPGWALLMPPHPRPCRLTCRGGMIQQAPSPPTQEPSMRTRLLPLSLACAALALLGDSTRTPGGPPKPKVGVTKPLTREVPAHRPRAGRTEAAARVELKARVSGYLDKVLFRDGARVKQGDVLLEIDPRLYRAELDRSEASLALAEVRLKRADAERRRAVEL